MDAKDVVKNIQWLFIATVLLMLFTRFTIYKLDMDLYVIYKFQKQILSNLIWDGESIEEIELIVLDEKKEYIKFEEELNNFENYMSKTARESLKIESLQLKKEPGRLYDISLYFNQDVSMRGELYFVDESPKKSNNSLGTIQFKSKVIILIRYLRAVLIVGECEVLSKSSDGKDYLVCDQKMSNAVIKDYDGYISDINKSKRTIRLNYDDHIQYIYNLTKLGGEVPLIKANVSIDEMWLGILLVSLFLQIYTLVTVRRLATTKEKLQSWLFVSWIFSEKKTLIDKLSTVIEGIIGVIAYSSLAFLPLYTAWHSQQIRLIIFEDKFCYELILISVFLSCLVLYYLFKTLKSQLKLQN